MHPGTHLNCSLEFPALTAVSFHQLLEQTLHVLLLVTPSSDGVAPRTLQSRHLPDQKHELIEIVLVVHLIQNCLILPRQLGKFLVVQIGVYQVIHHSLGKKALVRKDQYVSQSKKDGFRFQLRNHALHLKDAAKFHSRTNTAAAFLLNTMKNHWHTFTHSNQWIKPYFEIPMRINLFIFIIIISV